MKSSCVSAALVTLASLGVFGDAAAAGTATRMHSFSIPASPSGIYLHPEDGLLYILCGTRTNGDHALYVYTECGSQLCSITIPSSARMSRVDGFQIVGSTAYIVDSQGPIHSSSLGGSMYAVEWTNPCGCTGGSTLSSQSCSSSSATWNPRVVKTYTLSAGDASIGDGGGTDQYFRNSGVTVVGDHFYGVNGVHPVSGLTCCFPKSLVKAPLSGTGLPVTRKWSFDGSTLGRNVDMEGLTCGQDLCSDFLYIGDEYNWVYKLRLATSDAATAVEREWDLNSIVGDVPDDKGIEALTYSQNSGLFYAGIQETSMIYAVALGDVDQPTTTAAMNSTNIVCDTSHAFGGTLIVPAWLLLVPGMLALSSAVQAELSTFSH